MTVLEILRFSAGDAQAADIAAAIKRMFTAVEAAAPQGIQYLAAQFDEDEFLLVLHLADGVDNPLTQIDEAVEFRNSMRHSGSPLPQPHRIRVLGNYRLLEGVGARQS